MRSSAGVLVTIEGLHDAVHTYTGMIDTHSLVSFLYSAVCRKKKPTLLFWIYFVTGF